MPEQLYGNGKSYRLSQCLAKIRPFPNDYELSCERLGPHTTHKGTVRDYAYPGSETIIDWEEDDRRTFYGTWYPCTKTAGCILPVNHRGGCAL